MSAAIPQRGQQLVGSLAMQLAGTKGIIVVDRDSGEMVEVTPELKEAINGDNPASAFLAVPSQ